MQTTEILQIINMVDSEVNLPNKKLIAQVKLTPSARGGEDKRGLFQAAHFKQSGLCTVASTKFHHQHTTKKWAERCQGSAVWTSVPLEFPGKLPGYL